MSWCARDEVSRRVEGNAGELAAVAGHEGGLCRRLCGYLLRMLPPKHLVQLQLETDRQAVGEYPVGQLFRRQRALHGREQHRAAPAQPVFGDDAAGPVVVVPVGAMTIFSSSSARSRSKVVPQVAVEPRPILRLGSMIRDTRGRRRRWAARRRFQRDIQSQRRTASSQRGRQFFCASGFATGDADGACRGGFGHTSTMRRGVPPVNAYSVSPGASAAGSQPDEDGGQADARAFTLQRVKISLTRT